MSWNLRVVEDAETLRCLKFASEEDAQRFVAFVETYFNESGCGNGYGAYWPDLLPGKPQIAKSWIGIAFSFLWNRIDESLIDSMLYHILMVRLADNYPDTSKFAWDLEYTIFGIKFNMPDFPPTQRPKVGDMYRIPRSQFGDDDEVFGYKEGRVIEEVGDKLKVIPWSEINTKGYKPFEIEASRAIKINNWPQKYKYEYKSSS